MPCFPREHVCSVGFWEVSQKCRLPLQVTRLASMVLCRGIKFVARLIPSEFNVVVGGSREATSIVSQDVTRLLKREVRDVLRVI